MEHDVVATTDRDRSIEVTVRPTATTRRPLTALDVLPIRQENGRRIASIPIRPTVYKFVVPRQNAKVKSSKKKS